MMRTLCVALLLLHGAVVHGAKSGSITRTITRTKRLRKRKYGVRTPKTPGGGDLPRKYGRKSTGGYVDISNVAIPMAYRVGGAGGNRPQPAGPPVVREARVRVVDDRRICYDDRTLPSLFLLGCQKCATTTLHKALLGRCANLLDQGLVFEDEFWFSYKEKHFFDRNVTYARGLKWYAAHYPKCAAGVHGVDSTQGYGKAAKVPARLLKIYGAAASAVAQFVTILRDPVARLHSNYWHRRHAADPSIAAYPTFGAWATEQLAEAAACGGRKLFGRCGRRPSDGLYAGLYAEQLENWFDKGFWPDQFLLLAFTGVVKNPEDAVDVVLGHLGVDDLRCRRTLDAHPRTQMEKRRPGYEARRRYNAKTPANATVSADVRSALEAFYAPRSDALVRLVADRNPRLWPTDVDYEPCSDPKMPAAQCPWPY